MEQKIILGSALLELASKKEASEGVDFSIKELSIIISKVVGYRGEVSWDVSKPDGAIKKLLDNSKMKSIGWNASTDLEQGIKKVYKWYLNSL